jgi:3-dehydroquinate synthetase
VAHALEATTAIPHGIAVAYGLLAMLHLSASCAGLEPRVAAALERRVRALGPLPPLALDAATVMAALAHDKKAGRFIVLDKPGLPRVLTPPKDAVAAAVRHALR